MRCERCADTQWLCEVHKGPWEGETGCNCAGPGVPCPVCNPLARETLELSNMRAVCALTVENIYGRQMNALALQMAERVPLGLSRCDTIDAVICSFGVPSPDTDPVDDAGSWKWFR